MSGPHDFRPAWFRAGQVDVTTTVLITAIAGLSMVVNALVPSLFGRLLFVPGLGITPVRMLTWPVANQIGLWPVLGLFFFWYFGSHLEQILGRSRMLRLLIWAWLVHSVLAVVFGLLGTGEPFLAGISVLYYVVILLFVAEHPDLRFGIPFTQISFPAWAGVLVIVVISTLQLIQARALVTIVYMATCWLVMAVVARNMGMLAHIGWLPHLPARQQRRPKPPRTTRRAKKQQKAASVVTGPWEQEMKQYQSDRERLDQLLDKISSGGIASLSTKEQEELRVLSQRLKRE